MSRSVRYSQLAILIAAAVISVGFLKHNRLMGAPQPSPTAALAWKPSSAAINYQLSGTMFPGTPSQKAFARALKLDFSQPGKVLVTGDSVGPKGAAYTFDPAALALPSATDSMVDGDVTWLALPANAASVTVKQVLTGVYPSAAAPNRIVIQGTAQYTIDNINAETLQYHVVHSAQLMNTPQLASYVNYLSGSSDARKKAVLSNFAVLTQKAVVGSCQGVFDRIHSSLKSLDCVSQPFPDKAGWNLAALNASPHRITLSIRRNP
jgi:hypothetical protein